MNLHVPLEFKDLLSNQQLLFGICLFCAVSAAGFVVMNLVLGTRNPQLQKRLKTPLPGNLAAPTQAETAAAAKASQGTFAPLMQKISQAASRPIMPKEREEQSHLRKKLAHAGIYSSNALQVYLGAKLLLVFGGLILGAILIVRMPTIALLIGCTAALFGYMLPGIWLAHRVRSRQRTLQASLPDALDLMVVCVEAGLTIDAAIQRVGHEIALAHSEISRELGITHMETRIGLSRIDALRNLGHRTGCASLQSLAAMLVQAERFGTSIGQALRVHAESLRDKRRYAAEEQAAKTTVKLAFPVVLFIFPTVLLVLGGPAFILFFKSPIFSQ